MLGLVVERRHSHEAERVAIERRVLGTRNPDTPEFHALEAERRLEERRHAERRAGTERRSVSPWGLGKGYADDAAN